MAPNFFQKPEAALKRAHELILVGKEADALETLHDTIKARRHKQWTQVHEQIMFKHLELCVNLKKPHVAKDALFQYKALTQQIAVRSLESVIEKFLTLAESKTEEAQKTSIEKVEEIDDLDQADVPETLLLSVVSGAAAQDRMDRTVLAPWLRFLWDSYRNCLELLRNNAQVEHLYHRITRQSFLFCAKYQRRTEFRKLCELLRLHLNQIQKHQHLAHVVKLSSAESLTMMQETRLHQLDTAIQMELWQEAYRSAEDVHGMMQLSKEKDKRMVKPASYVNYYDKLALVFWKAGNGLFHAAALLQKFTIYKDMKKHFTNEEAQEQASRVLLATLSIPDGADAASDLTRHLDIEDQHVANIRLLSNLLRLPIAPTRAGILKEAARLGVPEMASESARTMYKLLENNFAPLRLAQDVEAHLVSIGAGDHEQYVDALRTVVATKALKQVSVIYDSISWARVQKIIPFYSELELERLVVDVSKHRYVRAQIDHRSGCVRFGAADATLAGGVDLEEADGFTGDDTQLGVEGIRAHLELMYNKLRSTVELLDGDKRREEMIARVKVHVNNYERNRQAEHDRILQRRKKIENYKETSERVKAERKEQYQIEQQQREEAKRAEEMKRLEQQNIESEKKRKQAEQEDIQRKIKQDQLRRMQQTAIYQDIIKEKGESAFHEMDPETVIREQRERLDKERVETQKRLQQQEKTFDHHVRAIHLEEMLQRKAVMVYRMQQAPKLHEEYEEKRVAKAIADHENAVKTWERLENVREAAEKWIIAVKENNCDDFQKKVADWSSKLKAVRDSRLAERAEERKKERHDQWNKDKADEERRKKEDEERIRQKLVDEQRIAGREVRGGNRREMDMDSVAMKDSDWRVGPRSQQPPRDRMGGERAGGFDRPRDGAFDRPRDGGFDRPRDGAFDRPPRDGAFDRPSRDRENMPSSQADHDGSWRSNMSRPAPPPAMASSGAYRPGQGLSRREDPLPPSREEFGSRRPVAAPAPAETAWSRGNVVKKDPENVTSPETAAPSGPSKFVPPHLRGSGASKTPNGPPASSNAGEQWARRDVGAAPAPGASRPGPPGPRDPRDPKDMRDAPPRDGRDARDGPPRRTVQRPPAGSGAEGGSWRTK